MSVAALSGLAGIAGGIASPPSGPAISGLTDTGSSNSSGSNFINVGNPLQNIGAILGAINSGGAVQGQTLIDFPSPINNLNSSSGFSTKIGVGGLGNANFGVSFSSVAILAGTVIGLFLLTKKSK